MAKKKRKITIAVDKKEKKPYTFERFPYIETKEVDLYTGDYGCFWPNLDDVLCLERKSLPDLLMCIGRERKRFNKCIQRMRSFRYSVIVVEASYHQLFHGDYGQCQVTPQSVLGSITSWQSKGIMTMACGSRSAAEDFTARYIYQIAEKVLSWSANRARVDAPSIAQQQAMNAHKRKLQ